MKETTQDFVNRNNIRFKAKRASSNPNMDDMGIGSTHWKCFITFSGREMKVPFSQGSAHKKPPTAADVLDCLASDAGCVDGSFEDFCDNLGYDADSRKAERTYKIVKAQAEELKALLGDEYDRLLDCERL